MSATVTPPTPGTTAPADPFPTGLQRVAALSGVGAALAMILAIVTNSSETPDFNAPAGEWAQYVTDESSALQLSGFFLMLAGFFLIFYAGVIRSALGGAENAARGFVRLGFIVLGGLVVGGLAFALGGSIQAMQGGLENGEPELAKAYGHLSGAVVAASAMGLAAALDAAGFIVLRTRALPVWTGILALVASVFLFLTTFYALDTGNDENIFGFAYFLGFLLTVIWLIATSIILTQRIGREPVAVHRYE
jgi:hypothetical protein